MRVTNELNTPAIESAFQNFNVGTKVQLRTQRATGDVQHFSSLIGFVKDEFLMVKSPMVRNAPFVFSDGEQILVRAFTGTKIYSFASTVIRTFLSPLYYMHLAYPETIHSAALRAEHRVKVNAPASVTYNDSAGARTSARATVVNLSSSGAAIDCEALVAVGEQLQLSFTVQSDGVERAIRAQVRVCSVSPRPASRSRDEDIFTYGLQFQNLDTEDQAVIRLLTYETLLTNRQNIA